MTRNPGAAAGVEAGISRPPATLGIGTMTTAFRRPSRSTAIALSGLLIAGVVAACSGGASGSPSAPSAPPSAQAAITLDALVAAPPADGSTVTVNAFFLASGDTAQLCSLVLESYPPQCGGGAVRITGEVPADVLAALESTDDPNLAQATWGQVEVTGTFQSSGEGGGPTIAITAIRPAAPITQGVE